MIKYIYLQKSQSGISPRTQTSGKAAEVLFVEIYIRKYIYYEQYSF